MSESYIQIDVDVVVCPKCGSDERTKYHNTVELADVIIRGTNYGKIQLRRTSCKRCGQHRIERFFYSPDNNSARRRADRSKPADVEVKPMECTTRKKSGRKSKRSTPRSKAE